MYLANKFNATLTSGFTVGQTVLNVSAVPENVPTLIVAAKGTDHETVFAVTDKTVNTLTGVSRIRGANVNLDSSTPLTCLNLVEFINQFGSTAKASGAEIDTGTEDAKIVTPKAIADSYIAKFKEEHNEDGTHAWDGWNKDTDTWVYVSATSFKIEGKDVTARFPKGTKIKLTQTTAKYFYVTASAFSTDTTVTITGGSDYTLGEAAITLPYYSYASTPQGHPILFNYAPTWTGYSTAPTNVIARFRLIGNECLLHIRAFTVGTSNADTNAASLPITATTITNMTWRGSNGIALDNGVILAGASMWSISSAGTVVNFYTSMALAAWTTSGNKAVSFQGVYEI